MPKIVRMPAAPPAPMSRERARAMARESLERMTDAEDAAITAAALADPDAQPFDHARARRGRPPLAHPKEAVKLRLDADILAAFRATGEGWQTRMNAALRKAAGL